jgi:ABC-type spermidine/putrescine transport system permease subunit II
LLAPSILAGFLLAFTFSFEDFIIAYFVAGPDVTLPIYIFSSIRRGITPEINAVGTVVLLTSFVLLDHGAADPATRAEEDVAGQIGMPGEGRAWPSAMG